MEHLPTFPEFRRERAFVEVKGEAVELIEVEVEVRGRRGRGRRRVLTGEVVREVVRRGWRGSGWREDGGEGEGERVKIFYSTRQCDPEKHLTPVPLAESVFCEMAPYARIPAMFVDVLARPVAWHGFARPEVPEEERGVDGKDGREGYLCFILRSAAKGINGLIFGASFTYAFHTRTLHAFIHIYEPPSYMDLAHALETAFTHSTPLLIPLFLVRTDMHQRYLFITNAHITLFNLEVQAGIRSNRPGHLATDFSALSRDISYFIGELALVGWACKTVGRQLAFLEEVGERWCAMAARNGVGGEEVEGVKRVFGEALEGLRCENGSVGEQAECLAERAKALIQTVYSGIAQRDAALSQNAAMAAARDSAIMRIIAAITMLFLPATTVATFFSTSFFDFQVKRHERVYSWWLWLYWVVTIVLTVVIMAGTFFWWRRKERELWAWKKGERAVSPCSVESEKPPSDFTYMSS